MTVTVVTPGATPVMVPVPSVPDTVAVSVLPVIHEYVPPAGVPAAVTVSVFEQSAQTQTRIGVVVMLTAHVPGHGTTGSFAPFPPLPELGGLVFLSSLMLS